MWDLLSTVRFVGYELYYVSDFLSCIDIWRKIKLHLCDMSVCLWIRIAGMDRSQR